LINQLLVPALSTLLERPATTTHRHSPVERKIANGGWSTERLE
jgi:hypothetical protein